jgi:hypothetical protein
MIGLTADAGDHLKNRAPIPLAPCILCTQRDICTLYSLDNSLMVLCCPGGFGLLEGPLHVLIGLVAGLHAQVLAVSADAQAPF